MIYYHFIGIYKRDKLYDYIQYDNKRLHDELIQIEILLLLLLLLF
jgi:hypothetical protein